MAPILPIQPSIPPLQAPSIAGVAGADTAGGPAFQSAFSDPVQQVEGFGQNASASINSFVSGEGEELHDVAIKTQQADYQEVMKMQVWPPG
jgi:flagellar hook-basal body complex protein FliE